MDYGTKPWFENQFKNLDVKGNFEQIKKVVQILVEV